jgi:DNA-binding LytR/AlgR family response regulator
MINAIIIDDEPSSREIIKTYIEDCSNINLVKECKNAFEANEIIQNRVIDLMFLDINMPKLSGLEFLKSLNNPPKVIFTTAYPEYAVDGFDLNAVDYLLKPFSFERFLKAVNKLPQTTKSNKKTFISFKSSKKIYRIQIEDINYIESLGDYIKISYSGNSIVVHDTLQSILSQINYEKIIRVHKSFAININKFDHIEGNTIKIGNKEIPIGQTHKQNLLSKL